MMDTMESRRCFRRLIKYRIMEKEAMYKTRTYSGYLYLTSPTMTMKRERIALLRVSLEKYGILKPFH